jgi:hypothetical protein
MDTIIWQSTYCPDYGCKARCNLCVPLHHCSWVTDTSWYLFIVGLQRSLFQTPLGPSSVQDKGTVASSNKLGAHFAGEGSQSVF